ncbi:hypothetical protein [Mesorhizobium sp. M0968]|uniref:methyltransferase family protein n=1 Tax=Mesorhizobium sp. M0968 TaxID=2957037 RepID=UPI0033358525
MGTLRDPWRPPTTINPHDNGSSSLTLQPKSATAPLTGLAGLFGLALAVGVLVNRSWPVHLQAMTAIAATAAAMIAVDTAYFQTFRRRSTGLQAKPMRALEVERVVRKLIGFIVTLTTIAAVYWIVPEYRRGFYAPYWAALYDTLPALLVAAPFYVAYVDRRQTDPEDSYAEIGAFVLSGAVPQRTEQIRQHVRGWIVKGFFLPLMFVYLCSTLGSILAGLEQPYRFDIMRWHAFAIDLLFMVDVLVAVVGYVFTLRVLDNHIRTVEPTVFGWLVCLACYEPINAATRAYLNYETGANWTAVMPSPALQVFWGSAILFCILIFVWSTVSFGLRFSNLTNRGIITCGPYRWIKHPAYVSKNLSWWLVSLPFLTAAGPAEALRHSAILLALNAIYALRAITEECHLSRDPDYVAYRDYISENGAVAQLKRLFAKASRSPIRRSG